MCESRRHALQLPAGSIRAIHVIGIVALACAVLWIPSKTPLPMPPFLIYLLFLMIGHYFAAHGVSMSRQPGDPRPLNLPGGLIRLFILAALGGTILYHYLTDADRLQKHFENTLKVVGEQPYVPLLLLAGFFAGVVVRTVVGASAPAWFQDIEAWISILAMLGLFVSLILLIINSRENEPYSYPGWEGALGAIIAFYFGERS